MEARPVLLISKYSGPDKLVVFVPLFIGLLFGLIGITVYLKNPGEWAARVFYCTCLAAQVAIMILWPASPGPGDWTGYLISFFYWLLFPLTPALILHFSLLYPKKRRLFQRHESLPHLIFQPWIGLIVLLEIFYFAAILTERLTVFRAFYWVYNFGFRSFLIVFLILSIVNVIKSYLEAVTRDDRNKVQWILWGVCLGILPFLFLWSLPQIFGFPPLIPEIIIYIFLMFIPVSVAFSIIKYQMLDIEIIIQKSMVYGFGTGFFLFVFFTVAEVTGFNFIKYYESYRFILWLILVIAVLLLAHPLSSSFQKVISRFFKGEYHFNEVIRQFGQALSGAATKENIIDVLLTQIRSVFKVNRILVLSIESNGHPGILAASGLTQELAEDMACKFQYIMDHSIPIHRNLKSVSLNHEDRDARVIPKTMNPKWNHLWFLPVKTVILIRQFVLQQSLEDEINPLHKKILSDTAMSLILPLVRGQNLLGYLLLGDKAVKTAYSEEDIELLSHLSCEAFIALEHAALQEEIILEQAEKEKLENLNQLKSEFLSLVSHEFQTPLTSITWSIENLLDGIPEKPSPKVKDYLLNIQDSSHHLTRMIEKLLNITRIEAGKLEYVSQNINLSEMVKKATAIINPLSEEKKIRVNHSVDPQQWVMADPDCLKEILINLIENAVKYSEKGSEIRIETSPCESEATKASMLAISIIDQGPGILDEKKKLVFDQFERIKDDTSRREKGLGLGLYIVRKLINLQGGQIQVKDNPSGGSIFTFTLPVDQS